MNPFIQPRLFTVAEVNALIPRLTTLFETLRPELARARTLAQELADLGHPTPDEGGIEVDADAPLAVQALQRRLKASFESLTTKLQEITEMGAEVKSAEGLVDFRTRRNGSVVYLCWRMGEQEVTHWHSLESGIAGRAPIADPHRFEGELLH